MKYPNEEAMSYVAKIDEHFKLCKETRESRFGVKWGMRSREINLELSEKIKAKPEHPETLILRYVFSYWINRSQLLELYHNSKYGKELAKRKIRKEGKDIWKIIESGDPGCDLDNGKTFQEFVKELINKDAFA